MDEQAVTVMGSLCPSAQYIPWVREWFQQEQEGILVGPP